MAGSGVWGLGGWAGEVFDAWPPPNHSPSMAAAHKAGPGVGSGRDAGRGVGERCLPFRACARSEPARLLGTPTRLPPPKKSRSWTCHRATWARRRTASTMWRRGCPGWGGTGRSAPPQTAQTTRPGGSTSGALHPGAFPRGRALRPRALRGLAWLCPCLPWARAFAFCLRGAPAAGAAFLWRLHGSPVPPPQYVTNQPSH